jgi:creatinine amidohydrolase
VPQGNGSRIDSIGQSANRLRYHARQRHEDISMLLHLQTWPAVESYLKQRRDIIMPIGSTEQHGPNGLIGTDAITAEVVAHAVAEATGALVAPTIAVGMAQHHLAFPGSMALRPSTLMAVIRDCVESLALHGFERFFFINGHGGNVPTTQAAFSEIHASSSFAGRADGRRLHLALHNWYEAAEVGRLSRELYGDQEGSHATPSEVSLTWHVHPQCAQPMTLDPAVAPRGSFSDAADLRRNFPDGRIGSNPGIASAEHGKRILDAAVESLTGRYRKWVGG